MTQNFNAGDKVVMSESALENYGYEYEGQEFEIEEVYTSTAQHRGFDESTGCALYHLKGLNFDLYDWELEKA